MTSEDSKLAPVYVPFATMISALDALKNHGIPASGKLDKTIWESQSGSIRGQLILAFKFLGLIDSHNQVLPTLSPVVHAPTPEERKALFKKIIQDKYRPVIALGLETISAGQLNEAFAKFGITGTTLKAAVRFFVKACGELNIPIAKRFSDKVRATGPRKKRLSNGKKTETPPVHPMSTPVVGGSYEAQLLAKFPDFDPAWPDDLKTKWFEGYGQLMGMKRQRSPGGGNAT